MFSFCKPKIPTVTWWPTIKYLDTVCPPVKSNQFIPEWFKKIKKSEFDEVSNVKLCPSFLQYFSAGWVIPLWCDFKLTINSVGNIEAFTPDSRFKFEAHGDHQYKNHLPDHEKDHIACVFKPASPWLVKISKGWSLLQLPMTFEFNKHWEVVPGILPSSIWHQTNPQVVIKKSFFKERGSAIILKGTPIAQYIPIPDEYKGEVVEESPQLKELDDRASLMIGQKFTKRYQTMTKCPYDKK